MRKESGTRKSTSQVADAEHAGHGFQNVGEICFEGTVCNVELEATWVQISSCVCFLLQVITSSLTGLRFSKLSVRILQSMRPTSEALSRSFWTDHRPAYDPISLQMNKVNATIYEISVELSRPDELGFRA
jgi:hypothetical protein